MANTCPNCKGINIRLINNLSGKDTEYLRYCNTCGLLYEGYTNKIINKPTTVMVGTRSE